MRKYRVYYKLHSADAKTKAALATSYRDGVLWPDTSGIAMPEFEARTLRDARAIVQSRILPGDKRKIMGRTCVSLFVA